MFRTSAMRAAHARTPSIRFLGKRTIPTVDHTPRPHPQSPTGELPQTWNTKGPIKSQQQQQSQGASAAQQEGLYFDRSELPKRFQRLPISEKEIEMVELGGAY